MRTLSRRMGYSRRLDAFFKHAAVDAVLLLMISASVVTAVLSLFVDSDALELCNLIFSAIFAIELVARFFTYSTDKSEYLPDWWMDWVATIPWDEFLCFIFPGGGVSMLRLLRLPRIFRLLRFRNIKRSDAALSLSYRFRRLLEVSMLRQVMTMILVSLGFVWIFTAILNTLGAGFEHGDNLWFSLITMISSDSVFEVSDQGTPVKIVILVLSFIGIVLFNGVLIAIIIGKLMERLDDLKSGRGDVREKGHIILLGFNECVPHIIDELESFCINERKRLIRVVVARERPPETTDQMVESRPHVEVITRIGSFHNADALERISAHKAWAVIVLGERAANSRLSERLNDPVVTRTLVALETLLDSKQGSRQEPVIVLNYLDLSRSYHVTEFLRPFGNRSVKVFFNPVFFTGKLIAAMCINPFAEDIYNELLTPEGNEFHIVTLPEGSLRRWRDLMNAFPRSIPVGYRDGSGEMRMAPPPDDELPGLADVIVLSEDSHDASLFEPSAGAKTDRKGPSPHCPDIPFSGTLLIVGANPRLPFIIDEMSSIGVSVTVADNQTEEEFRDWYGEYSRSPLPVGVLFRECRFRSEKEVRSAVDLPSFDRIVLLADGHLLDSATPDQIDAETTSRLLMLSHMIEEAGAGDVRMIVETLTVDSEAVVRNIRSCSNVIAPLTIARLLTTFTLQPEFEELFRTIIQHGDIDIACRPVEDSVMGFEQGKTTFGKLLEGAHNGCIPLGWVETEPCDSSDRIRGGSRTVTLNPPKRSEVPPGSDIIFLRRQGHR